MNLITKKVTSIIKSLSFYDDEILLSDKLEDLGIDSLSRVDLIIAVEDKFGMQFEMSELDSSQWETVGELVDLVTKYSGVTSH